MRNFWVALGALTVFGWGCRGSSNESTGSDSSTVPNSVANVSPAVSSTPSSSSKPACPRTGKWALCSVETRLKQSGFVIEPAHGSQPRREGFSVSPVAYTLGKSRLEVFIYASPEAAAKDVARLDTLAAALHGARSNWAMPPTFVRSANLIAVFLTESQVQAERLTLALTAGPPQP